MAKAPAAGGSAARGGARAVTPVPGLKGSGEPLSPSARGHFEPRFGVDLSHVRIHTGDAAAKVASGLGARAFAHGPHIGFAAGRFAPDTHAGSRLLAHELAHVVQQTASVLPVGAPGRWALTRDAGGPMIRRDLMPAGEQSAVTRVESLFDIMGIDEAGREAMRARIASSPNPRWEARTLANGLDQIEADDLIQWAHGRTAAQKARVPDNIARLLRIALHLAPDQPIGAAEEKAARDLFAKSIVAEISELERRAATDWLHRDIPRAQVDPDPVVVDRVRGSGMVARLTQVQAAQQQARLEMQDDTLRTVRGSALASAGAAWGWWLGDSVEQLNARVRYLASLSEVTPTAGGMLATIRARQMTQAAAISASFAPSRRGEQAFAPNRGWSNDRNALWRREGQPYPGTALTNLPRLPAEIGGAAGQVVRVPDAGGSRLTVPGPSLRGPGSAEPPSSPPLTYQPLRSRAPSSAALWSAPDTLNRLFPLEMARLAAYAAQDPAIRALKQVQERMEVLRRQKQDWRTDKDLDDRLVHLEQVAGFRIQRFKETEFTHVNGGVETGSKIGKGNHATFRRKGAIGDLSLHSSLFGDLDPFKQNGFWDEINHEVCAHVVGGPSGTSLLDHRTLTLPLSGRATEIFIQARGDHEIVRKLDQLHVGRVLEVVVDRTPSAELARDPAAAVMKLWPSLTLGGP